MSDLGCFSAHWTTALWNPAGPGIPLAGTQEPDCCPLLFTESRESFMSDIATQVAAHSLFGVVKAAVQALKARSPKKALENGRKSLAVGIDEIMSYDKYHDNAAVVHELIAHYEDGKRLAEELEAKIQSAPTNPVKQHIAMNRIYSDFGRPFLATAKEFEEKAVRTSRDLYAYHKIRATGSTSAKVDPARVPGMPVPPQAQNPFEQGDDNTVAVTVDVSANDNTDEAAPSESNSLEGDIAVEGSASIEIELDNLGVHIGHTDRRHTAFEAIASALINGAVDLADTQLT